MKSVADKMELVHKYYVGYVHAKQMVAMAVVGIHVIHSVASYKITTTNIWFKVKVSGRVTHNDKITYFLWHLNNNQINAA